MRARCQKFAVVVLGQAICLAVGLFMQRQLFGTALHRAEEHAVWSKLEAASDQLQRTVTSPDPDRVHAAVEQMGLGGVETALVDRAWRPVSAAGARVATQPLQFTPFPDNKRASTGAGPTAPPEAHEIMRGTLAGTGTPRLAMARLLPGGRHRLVVHHSGDAIEERVNAALAAMLPVNAVTFLWTIALLGMTVFLLTSRHQELLDDERARSTSHVLRQTQEIVRTRDGIIFALAKLAGSRDNETGAHLERISAYSKLIAAELRHHPHYIQQVTPSFVRLIELSAVLHDIGKVGVEDSVLRKPGPLTESERDHMQTHTVIGGQCLGEIAQRLGGSNFLEMARNIALAHHERWDGTGYPVGLQGQRIPLAARIVAIADVYDAMVTRRVYKRAIPHVEAIATIAAGAGTEFDPELVQVVLRVQGGLRDIMRRHTEPDVVDGPEAGRSDGHFVPEQSRTSPGPALAGSSPADQPVDDSPAAAGRATTPGAAPRVPKAAATASSATADNSKDALASTPS